MNPEMFADGIPVFDNRDVVDCQQRTRGSNHRSSFGNVYDPGIVYRQRVRNKAGSSIVRLKLGLADIQLSGGYLGDTGITGSYAFRNSCESVVTDTTISVQLVQRTKTKTGYKIIRRAPNKSNSPGSSIKLKRPGFKSTAYINELLGANGRRAGLKDGRLEWTKQTKFRLPRKLTRRDLKNKTFGVRVEKRIRPLVEVPLKDLADIGMSKYDRSIYPKTVRTRTYVSVRWLR